MKRYIIIYGFFVSIVMVMLMLFTMARWYHFKNNDGYSITVKKVKAKYEEISNPASDKRYFHKIEKTKIIKCETFPFLETIITERNFGLFSQDKN